MPILYKSFNKNIEDITLPCTFIFSCRRSETVRPQKKDKVSRSNVEEDVLKIQQNSKPKRTFQYHSLKRVVEGWVIEHLKKLDHMILHKNYDLEITTCNNN